VEASTNLLQWTTVRTFPSATPPMTFTNPGPAQVREFFRVRLGP
jgi:hypothetical protein